jgi:nicotinamide-nucleotide amidase
MGVVSYSNEAKQKVLGVPTELLERHGAVSDEVARAMADGVRHLSGADIGLSVTGIAGPTGGSPQKPVGLVYIALGSGTETVSRKHQFSGSRIDIKLRTSQTALDMLRTSIS